MNLNQMPFHSQLTSSFLPSSGKYFDRQLFAMAFHPASGKALAANLLTTPHKIKVLPLFSLCCPRSVQDLKVTMSGQITQPALLKNSVYCRSHS